MYGDQELNHNNSVHTLQQLKTVYEIVLFYLRQQQVEDTVPRELYDTVAANYIIQ